MSKYKFEEIAINCTQKKMPTEEDRPLYIGLEHLDTGNLHVDRWGSSVPLKGEKLIMRKNDVLLGKRNAYLRRAAVAPHDGIFSAHGMVLQPREDVVDKDFFPLFIASDYFFDEAVRISVGSLSPTINWKDLRGVEFELPCLDKQRELAKVLWAMDATKKSYQKLMLKTDKLVKAQFIEMFGDVKSNPKKLKVCPLGDVCIVERGGSPRPIAKYITDSPLGINWIKIGDADESRYITRTEEKIIPEGLRKTRRVKAGDLILSNSMSFGHPYILKIDGCIHDGWLVLHFEESVFDAIYLQTYLGLPATYALFASVAAGGVVNNLNSELVRKLPVLIPSIDTQKEFAAFVRQSDKSKSDLQQALEELTATYKKIISENLG